MLVTTNTKSRVPIFQEPACARIAIETLYHTQLFYPFFLFHFVIMPDHAHLFLNVPEGGSVSKSIGMWKRSVCFAIGRGSLRQSRFDITYPKNIHTAIQYIWWNPVKAGLCEKPEDYPWSSASGKWDVMPMDDL